MELTFLGTRGGIDIRSRRHRRHSALLVEKGDIRIMIDCGADWLHRLDAVAPSAIVLTYAHADHAAGLVKGALCPVYAPAVTWRLLSRLPILNRRTMPLRKAVLIRSIRFSAIPAQHSIRAPAVGYRVSADDCCFFYLPDVADLPKAADALHGIDVYIGDGATVRRSMVRRKGGEWVGHAPVVRQLDWCAKAHVRLAVFTHCGSPIVRADANALGVLVSQLMREHGLEVQIACDGDRLSFRPRSDAIGARA